MDLVLIQGGMDIWILLLHQVGLKVRKKAKTNYEKS